ncbi:hypothetical protein SDC9_113972 [bioreactor metagenome]|uniref:Uncharacterized protein n=1 Tax=bioreactor metagenome TaxID=1076179 RepID=A0A645BNV8_9ZZZZ
MKKYFIILTVLLFFTFLLSGCKSNTQVKNENNNNINLNNENDNTKSSNNQSTNNSNNNNSNSVKPGSTEQEKPVTEKPSEQKPGSVPPAENKPSIKDTNCRLYFFNTKELAMYYVDTTIQVEDNAIIKALTKELQNQNYSKDFLTLTNKVQIKSAKVDRDKKLLTVVFSDSYINHMILGNATESGLLVMLLSTYGYNLGVDKVAIYFNDELYTSLRGELPEGYFKVNYGDAKKFVK